MTAASDLSCMRRPHSTTRIESAFRMEARRVSEGQSSPFSVKTRRLFLTESRIQSCTSLSLIVASLARARMVATL